jgi:hypothetical protein
MVLLAAALGTYAFFQPFYSLAHEDRQISAYRNLVGYEIDEIKPEELGVAADQLDSKVAKEQLRKLNAWVQSDHVARPHYAGDSPDRSYVPYYFSSVALLICVVFYAFVERKLRSSAAVAVVIASLPALWGFSRAWRGAAIIDRVDLGPGAWMLGGTGVLALAIGIAALVREDPGGFFRNAPTDDDELVEEIEDPRGRRTVRDPRDL